MGNKRISFTFREKALRILEEMTREGNFASMVEIIQKSLQTCCILQKQAQDGFTEVIVRNHETGEERVIIVPPLQSPHKGKK
jgi:hypothetical protein